MPGSLQMIFSEFIDIAPRQLTWTVNNYFTIRVRTSSWKNTTLNQEPAWCCPQFVGKLPPVASFCFCNDHLSYLLHRLFVRKRKWRWWSHKEALILVTTITLLVAPYYWESSTYNLLAQHTSNQLFLWLLQKERESRDDDHTSRHYLSHSLCLL